MKVEFKAVPASVEQAVRTELTVKKTDLLKCLKNKDEASLLIDAVEYYCAGFDYVSDFSEERFADIITLAEDCMFDTFVFRINEDDRVLDVYGMVKKTYTKLELKIEIF